MRLGLGLSLTSSVGAPAVFTPASLALTGWWRDYSGASPWVGTASAGVSGSQDLTEATNPPSAGTALNTHGTADFDGTNDTFTADDTLATYFDNNKGSCWALVNIDAIDSDLADALAYLNDSIWSESNAIAGLFVRTTGPTAQAFFDDTVGGLAVATVAISTGAWIMIQQRWNGSNNSIRLNSGSWVDVADGTGLLNTMSGTVKIGRNYNAANFLNGRIAELGFTDSTLSDATFDQVKSYINARYALSL